MFSLDDPDDQVAKFSAALWSLLRGVELFLQLATGVTETVELASISDFIWARSLSLAKRYARGRQALANDHS